jgi:RNA polymerase sigma-70 factor, ECF subfamily
MNAQTTISVTDVTRDAIPRFYGMDRDCELELVRRVQNGDRDAFDVVHAVFNARLFGFLARLARSRDVAEDLLEERAADSIGLWPAGLPDSPFDCAVGSELERRIEAALASVPVSFREVLLLVGVEGLRPTEAAVICGVSPEALRQRLKRARALLAARLAAMGLRPSVDLGEVRE